MKFVVLIFISFAAYAVEGYQPDFIKISYDKEKKAFITNTSCSPVTVYVNGRDVLVNANSEVKLNSEMWNAWVWHQGEIGKMDELTFVSPLKEKFIPDYGPGHGQTHVDGYYNSYDFSVPEGTDVYAMEEGTVVRIVQKYTLAHQDKSRIDEVNSVRILHKDGSLADYVHIQANSVSLKLCDKVVRGQVIAKSGNNGFSRGPHLHVDVFRPLQQGKFGTIPLKFTPR